MSITRDEVAHLARLARLELSEDELAQMAGQLDAILGAVARVAEVACDIGGTSSRPASPRSRCWPAPRPPRTTASACPGFWGRSRE